MKQKILVILGSTREGRNGEKVANNLMEVLGKRTDADYELVDLKDYALPLFDDVTPPSVRTEPYEGVAGKWQKKITEADGYIFITAEYNHSVPGVLKNAIDYLFSEWQRKPMAVVSYGNIAGGSRAAEHLRMIAVELQMAPIRLGVHIPNVWSKFDEENRITEPHFEDNVNAQAEQLAWWTNALKTALNSD